MIPIAITGATGKLGRLVINRLKSKIPTADILALARTTAKAAELDVPVRECDYREVESLDTALNGVKTLLLISSSEVGQRIFEHRNVIEAANKSRVKSILYTSRSTLTIRPSSCWQRSIWPPKAISRPRESRSRSSETGGTSRTTLRLSLPRSRAVRSLAVPEMARYPPLHVSTTRGSSFRRVPTPQGLSRLRDRLPILP